MPEATIANLVETQRAFFGSGVTKDICFRREQLRKLRAAIRKYEPEILKALGEDLGKPGMEAFLGETAMVESEVEYALRSLPSWMKPRSVRTPLTLFPAECQVVNEPYGVVLIIAPWNYPFGLLMSPLAGALAAGNCAVLKPSEISGATSKVMASMIGEFFEPRVVGLVEGGVREAQTLLSQKFDYIFYTGNTNVGRTVMEAASRNLTPVTLELGGKSPCIVYRIMDTGVAARRIVWGKFFNAGQTCTAPDYLLVENELREKVLTAIKGAIRQFYGDDPSGSPDYGRIINERHYDRLMGLLEGEDIITGGSGDRDRRYIAPTVINNVSWDSRLMKEEIFGPLLPVIPYSDLREVLARIRERPKPLALYIFSDDAAVQESIIGETSSGGICVNDTVVQVGSKYLPFGGVGESGLGAYHGEETFATFSHRKSVMKRPFLLDPPFRYPPYSKPGKLFKRFIAFFS